MSARDFRERRSALKQTPGWPFQANAKGAQRSDFYLRVQPSVQRIEDFNGFFERDAAVLIALIPRDLGLVYFESSSQLALRYPLSDADRNQQVAESAKIVEVVKLTTLETFVTLSLLLQLTVK